MEKNVLNTIRYFTFFQYPPHFSEIQRFFPRRISEKTLQKELQGLIKRNRLIEKDNCYTPPEYKTLFQKHRSTLQATRYKLHKVEPYVRLLSLFPQIKLVGLSGSVAMMNAKEDDDIDLFVITAKNRLWTGRFIANIVAFFHGLKRQRALVQAKNKVCLNLFFDEGDLSIAVKKQTKFVAHEILQMKPIIDRDEAYKRFLEANKWVFELFPNAPRSIPNFLTPLEPLRSREVQSREKLVSSLGNLVESLLKRFQLYFIRKHQTTEIITDTQLWFFPGDFEKKLPKNL